MKNFLILIRPWHYIKNLFIFLPLFFALKITELDLLSRSLLAFAAFCFTASAIYILNDFIDINDDRLHPTKRFRPLASGAVGTKKALVLMFILFGFGFSGMFITSFHAGMILLLYVIMNIAYSLHLKHVAILDISLISVGFVLRLFIGSAVAYIPLSKWIVIMTFLLALFLALAKRRDDVLIYLKTGEKMRKVIGGYNLKFLDAAMAIMASVVIVAYIMYSVSTEVISRINNQYLYLTALFVILGIMRYLQVIYIQENSGSPTKVVLKDNFLQTILAGWILTFVWLIY